LKLVGFFFEYSENIVFSMFSMLSEEDVSIWNSVSWILMDDMFLRNVYASFFFMNSSISLNLMSPVFPWVRVPLSFNKTILSRRFSLSSSEIIFSVAVSPFSISISIETTSFIGTLMFCVFVFVPMISTS